MILEAPLPFATTIFCDDIRQEVSGKFIYFGVYTNEMMVTGAVPVAIPQLCLGVTFRDDIQRLLTEPMTYKVIKSTDQGEEVLYEAEYEPPSDIPDFPMPPAIGKRDGTPFNELRVEARLSPFIVDGPCLIKSRMYRGADAVLCGALRIQVQNEPAPTIEEA